MAIDFSTAVSAYQKVARQDTVAEFGKPQKTPGADFADVLRQATEGAVDTLREGERQTLSAAVGGADLTDVVTAVSKAEMTLRMVVTVRDRVIHAYQEILRMPI